MFVALIDLSVIQYSLTTLPGDSSVTCKYAIKEFKTAVNYPQGFPRYVAFYSVPKSFLWVDVSSGNNTHGIFSSLIRLKIELGRKNEIFYKGQKEDLRISRMAKFCSEMLEIKEYVPLRSLQALYIFVLRAEKVTLS